MEHLGYNILETIDLYGTCSIYLQVGLWLIRDLVFVMLAVHTRKHMGIYLPDHIMHPLIQKNKIQTHKS